jgi:hypothetical protein
MVFETIPIQSLILPLLARKTSSKFTSERAINPTNIAATKAARDSMDSA